MQEDHVGYLDFDGKITRFQSAYCEFVEGRLSVEAVGTKVKLRLYGIPFTDAESIADLIGKTFGPTDEGICGDPFAEGGIETKNMWLSFQSLECKCRSYDAAAKLITVWFSAEVEDYESGKSGNVDCSVRCTIREDRPSQKINKFAESNTLCLNCSMPLRTNLAKQCFHCGAKWH